MAWQVSVPDEVCGFWLKRLDTTSEKAGDSARREGEYIHLHVPNRG